MILNIGKYIDITIVPIIKAMKTITKGSKTLVRDVIDSLTSL